MPRYLVNCVLYAHTARQQLRRQTIDWDEEGTFMVQDAMDLCSARLRTQEDFICKPKMKVNSGDEAEVLGTQAVLPNDELTLYFEDNQPSLQLTSPMDSQFALPSPVATRLSASSQMNSTQSQDFFVSSGCFVDDEDYEKWKAINDQTIQLTYKQIAKTHIGFNGVPFYEFFDCTKYRACIILIIRPNLLKDSPANRLITLQVQREFNEAILDLLKRAYPDFNACKPDIKKCMQYLAGWLNKDWVRGLVKAGNRCPITSIWNQQKARARLTNGMVPPLKKRRLEAEEIDVGEIEQHALDLKETRNAAAIYDFLVQTSYIRLAHLKALKPIPEQNIGVGDLFFKKFPIFVQNIDHLHTDFVNVMMKTYGWVPDLGAEIRRYADSIIEVAKYKGVDVYESIEDKTLIAGKIVPLLLKKYKCGLAKHCSLHKLYLETDNLHVEGLMEKKKQIVKVLGPSIMATYYNNARHYFIAVDDLHIPVNQTIFADALQKFYEVSHVLNLKCDSGIQLLMDFFDALTGVHKDPKVGMKRVVRDIQLYSSDFPAPNEEIDEVDDETMNDHNGTQHTEEVSSQHPQEGMQTQNEVLSSQTQQHSQRLQHDETQSQNDGASSQTQQPLSSQQLGLDETHAENGGLSSQTYPNSTSAPIPSTPNSLLGNRLTRLTLKNLENPSRTPAFATSTPTQRKRRRVRSHEYPASNIDFGL